MLEELVGPIQDEFDRETPPITPLGDNVFEVDASCPLDVLAETCGMEIPETDAETAGGLVLDLLGRLAKPGDSVTINGHRLTVLRADPDPDPQDPPRAVQPRGGGECVARRGSKSRLRNRAPDPGLAPGSPTAFG